MAAPHALMPCALLGGTEKLLGQNKSFMLGFAFLNDSFCATAVWLQICIALVVEH